MRPPDEELLAGGIANQGNVTRVGNEVIRPAGRHTPAVHQMLAHLAKVGFLYAPAPIKIDRDHEHVSYVTGVTPQYPYPDWCLSDETLVRVARLMRTFHDAMRGFTPSPELSWSTDLADPQGGAIVCHNDLLPENIVFEDMMPIGLIDFDFAAPGRPVWDIARAVRMWVPVDDPESAATYAMGHLDPFRRLTLFCDSYGLKENDRRDLVETFMSTQEVGEKFVRKQVAAGLPGFVAMWNRFDLESIFRKRRAWLQTNHTKLVQTLCHSEPSR